MTDDEPEAMLIPSSTTASFSKGYIIWASLKPNILMVIHGDYSGA